MDFARRRQRQAALGSINLGFIAAIICLRIFEGYWEARGKHRWVEKEPWIGEKIKEKKKETEERAGRKGESNREQTIYPALNYFIRSGVQCGNGEHELAARGIPDTRVPWKLINAMRQIYWSYGSNWLHVSQSYTRISCSGKPVESK